MVSRMIWYDSLAPQRSALREQSQPTSPPPTTTTARADRAVEAQAVAAQEVERGPDALGVGAGQGELAPARVPDGHDHRIVRRRAAPAE